MSDPSPALVAAVEQWIQYDPNPTSKAKVEALYNAKDYTTLSSLFEPRIAFGTAGLRSRMDVGYRNMNELVIVQATQGFITYVLQQIPDATQRGIVIGHDARHNSQLFAHIAANVIMSKNVPVILFNKIVPTPLVPFGVMHTNAAAGIMITASHNPKDDNGYKVYWSNGAQIIPPHDTGIAHEIDNNLVPWNIPIQTTIDNNISPSLHVDKTDEIIEAYYKSIRSECCKNYDNNNTENTVSATYTAMHGVGAEYTRRAIKEFNLPDYIPTVEQQQPDPEFPTVAFPNPEEGKGALELAVKTANNAKSRLILANDPDADRLAVSVKALSPSSLEAQPPHVGNYNYQNTDQLDWTILTGNEIAILFADWAWYQWRKEHGPDADPSKCLVVASTVSSKCLRAMAQYEGFEFRDTLTGFKWMGNEAIKAVQNDGYTLLVAYEVEIGFVVGHTSFDKDGVRTAAVMYELCNYWATQHNQTLLDRIDLFYKKYGYFKMINSYYFATPDQVNTIVGRLRQYPGVTTTTESPYGYPTHCTHPTTNDVYTIKSVRDISLGTDTLYDDHKSRLPQMMDAQMITLSFDNGATCTLRNSGTEPKLKYYIEASATTEIDANNLVYNMRQAIINDFIQPELYDLKHKAE